MKVQKGQNGLKGSIIIQIFENILFFLWPQTLFLVQALNYCYSCYKILYNLSYQSKFINFIFFAPVQIPTGMRKCLELLKCPRGLVNYLAPPSYEDLKIAVIKGDVQKIDSLIQNGVSLFGNGESILHFCITEKNLEILQKFCKQFPDIIDERNDDGDSPFMMAIFAKYKEAIDYLGRISNLNICDNNGNTAFMIAAANGDIEALKFILSKNRECMFVKNFEGQNALHRASYFGQIETVSFLIRRTHLKFGMKDKKGNTSLHCACKGLSFGVARYIIRKVQNWEDTLIVKNKEKMDPFDLMMESVNKIGDKAFSYTREKLEIAIIGESFGSGENEVDGLARLKDRQE